MEPMEKKEPIEAIEQADPIEPIERTEPLEPIERNESSDHNDHREVAPVTFIGPSCREPGRDSVLRWLRHRDRQDCLPWHSGSNKDHRLRRGRCRNCWPCCRRLGTATFETHAALWVSRNARLPESSLAPRPTSFWSDYVTPSRMQRSRSRFQRGGGTHGSRYCATLLLNISRSSFVVVAGPSSSRSCGIVPCRKVMYASHDCSRARKRAHSSAQGWARHLLRCRNRPLRAGGPRRARRGRTAQADRRGGQRLAEAPAAFAPDRRVQGKTIIRVVQGG